MFSQDSIQATLQSEPRYSARIEAQGKSRKPKVTVSQEVVNVINSPHEVPGTSRGRHGDPTLGPQADIEHCNLLESDYRADIRVQDTDSISCQHASQEQTVGVPVDQGGHDKYDSTFREMERELEELKQANEQLDRQEAKRQSQQKLAQLDRMIQEEQEKLNRRSTQLNTPYPTISQAPLTLKHQDSPSYPTGSSAGLRENPRPQFSCPNYNHPTQSEGSKYSATVERCGETPQTVSSPQFNTLYRNLPNLKQFADFKREGEYIKLKMERFDELCDRENILTDQERYKLLGALLMFEDEENYKNKFVPASRNYQTLKEFLLGEEGRVSCVLRPRDERYSVSSRELEDERGKWMAELKDVDILRKFVTIHLAPTQLKNKIREKSHLSGKEFGKAVRGLCDTVSHETRVNAKHINYTNRRPAMNWNPNSQMYQPKNWNPNFPQ